MKAATIISLTIAALIQAGSAAAQTPAVADPTAPEVRAAYQAVHASVVRLRTEASVELTHHDPESGLRSIVERPLSISGTGVIIGTVDVGGRTEYLVLTNHHVADPTNYVVQDGAQLRENRNNTQAVPSVPEQTFLALSTDADESDDIPLIEIVRDVRGDMALLRTVGADRSLPVFPGRIGFQPGEMEPGMPVVTSGYPNGGQLAADQGEIVEIDRDHDLGPAHADFVLSVPVQHGQSGSPVFVAYHDAALPDAPVEFVMIGLLHARELGTSYMVPTTLWEGSLDPMEWELDAAPAELR